MSSLPALKLLGIWNNKIYEIVEIDRQQYLLKISETIYTWVDRDAVKLSKIDGWWG
jgi:hypothetical protein